MSSRYRCPRLAAPEAMRTKTILIASAAMAALALPALAQQSGAPIPAPAAAPTPTANTVAATPAPDQASSDTGADESAVEEVSNVNLEPPKPPVEYPGWARRDPWTVGAIAPGQAGLTDDAWGEASGAFLSTLMRRMHTPLASRWAHIALRDALLAKLHAPPAVNPVDWAA